MTNEIMRNTFRRFSKMYLIPKKNSRNRRSCTSIPVSGINVDVVIIFIWKKCRFYSICFYVIGYVCAWTICELTPCRNGGVCDDMTGTAVCRCPSEFGGPRCETNLQTCSRRHCTNQGRCVFAGNQSRPSCQCGPSWTGKYIEEASPKFRK